VAGRRVNCLVTSRSRGRYAKRTSNPFREGLGRLRARSTPAKIGAAVALAALVAALLAATLRTREPSSAAGRGVTSTDSRQAGVVPGTATATTNVGTTTTIDQVPPGTPIDVPAKGLGIGSRGPAVLAVNQRLTQLRYDPGVIDDSFGYGTYYAVIAFEKVHSLPRSGRVTPDLAAAMVADGLPAPMIGGAEPTRAEIDLTRQVLFFWQGGRLVRILPVSSGFGGHYCGDDGSCGIAVTPIGSYRAASKIRGMHKSPLGFLWDPVFFNQGIAIHGEPSVPSTPASHGCVRIPMQDSTWMYDQLALGTPVYVRDATHVPAPFDKGGQPGPPQPGGTPPTLPHRTTTTRATTTTTKPHPPATSPPVGTTTTKPH
jgi:peptidoglycan hydrolase-like protein with peptidoglycan-binding domain